MWKYCLLFALSSQLGIMWAQKPPLGESIFLLKHFGFYTWYIRMITVNHGQQCDTWIFREPSNKVLAINAEKQSTQIAQQCSLESVQEAYPEFDGKCEIDFCDDKDQLLAAYFRNFTIEKLNNTWHGFTVERNNQLNDSFGIPDAFLSTDYSYILLRTYRIHDRQSLSGSLKNVNLVDEVDQALRNIVSRSMPQIKDFMTNYGSHYIGSYTTGDSLYQVFVYSKENYAIVKAALNYRDINNLTNAEINDYFSLEKTIHIGRIRTASGFLVDSSSANRYMNILKIQYDPDAVQVLDNLLEDRALLQLDMPILASVFKNETQRNWFYEIISNLYVNIEINYVMGQNLMINTERKNGKFEDDLLSE